MPAQENALKSAIRIGYCPSVPETSPHTGHHARSFVKKRNFKRMNEGREAPESYLISGSGHCNLVHSNIRTICNNFPIKPALFYLAPCAMVMFSKTSSCEYAKCRAKCALPTSVLQFASICSVALQGSRCKPEPSSHRKGWRPLAYDGNVNNKAQACQNKQRRWKISLNSKVKHGARRRREIVTWHTKR